MLVDLASNRLPAAGLVEPTNIRVGYGKGFTLASLEDRFFASFIFIYSTFPHPTSFALVGARGSGLVELGSACLHSGGEEAVTGFEVQTDTITTYASTQALKNNRDAKQTKNSPRLLAFT